MAATSDRSCNTHILTLTVCAWCLNECCGGLATRQGAVRPLMCYRSSHTCNPQTLLVSNGSSCHPRQCALMVQCCGHSYWLPPSPPSRICTKVHDTPENTLICTCICPGASKVRSAGSQFPVCLCLQVQSLTGPFGLRLPADPA